MTQSCPSWGPTIQGEPTSDPAPRVRAIGQDQRISGQGIMASGTWQRRINRSKTWPHPGTAAAEQNLNLLTERRPDRVEDGRPGGWKRTAAKATSMLGYDFLGRLHEYGYSRR